MSDFTVISRYGDGNGLAWRLMQEGNQVKIYYPEGKVNKNYEGMVPEIYSKDDIDGIVIVDMTGMDKLAEELKDEGMCVIGSGMGVDENGDYISDKMEHDRLYALRLMMQLGINVPETYAFNKPEEAMAFIVGMGGEDRWVAKPIGEAECDMTLVSKDNEQLKAALQGWIDEPSTKNTKLILQKFVEGIEVNPEIWFSNGNPVLPATLLFETKKFMNKDKGPTVGCAASTVCPYTGRLIDKTIKKIYPFIKKLNYSGPIDCSVIIDKKGIPWFLEAGWRLGYSSTYAEIALLDMPLGEFLEGIAYGTLKKIPWKKGYGGSLRITQNPYPYTNEDWTFQQKVYECIRGIEIPHAPFVEDLDCFPMEIYREYEDCFKTMGNYGIACEMGGFGATLKQLWDNIEKKADKLELPNAEYRTNNAQDVEKRINDFNAADRK